METFVRNHVLQSVCRPIQSVLASIPAVAAFLLIPNISAQQLPYGVWTTISGGNIATIDIPAGQALAQFEIRDVREWYFNGVPSPGGQTDHLTATIDGTFPTATHYRFDGYILGPQNSLTIADPPAAQYRLRLFPTTGITYIDSYQIRATYYPPAPVIVAQPQSRSVAAGGSVSFSVSAQGTSLSYQWQKAGNNIAGATGATLTFNAVQPTDADAYRVIVSNSGGSATSSDATLTVLSPPQITAQPQSAGVMPGGTATFSVTAGGTSPLGYQWMKNGANVGGATTATLTLQNVSFSDAGIYSVRVSNSVGNQTSGNAVLTVGPAITVQPTDVTVPVGSTATFGVTAVGSPLLTYQWSLNGSPLGGQTAATLAVNAQADKAGVYTVRVANSAGAVTSRTATLALLVPPTITAQPRSYTAADGESVTFTVQAAGAPPLSYQWHFQNSSGGPFLEVPGGTGSTLAMSNVTEANAGAYTVTIANGLGAVTSGAASLIVTPEPKIISQPQNRSVPPGTNVTFAVVAAGRSPLFFQWFLGTQRIPGATNASLLLTNTALSDSGGLYSVAVSNAWGSVLSSAAQLTVSSAFANVGTRLWSASLPSIVPPAFGPDGSIYLTSSNTTYSLSPAGITNWLLPGWTVGPIGPDGTAYVFSSNGIAAVSSAGSLRWSNSFPSSALSDFTVRRLALRSDGHLVCYGSRTLICDVLGGESHGPYPFSDTLVLRRESGVFSTQTLSQYPSTPSPAFGVILEDDSMVVGHEEGWHWCITREWIDGYIDRFGPDGALTLRVSPGVVLGDLIPGSAGELIFHTAPVSVSGNTATYGNRRLVAYSSTGRPLWESSCCGLPVISLDGALVLAGTGRLVCLNTNGTLRWEMRPPTLTTTERVFTPVIAADGTIYFTAGSRLYACDGAGANLWQFATPETVVSAPTIGPDGAVYFSTSGSLYSIKGAAPMAATAWPVEGGTPRRTFRTTRPPSFTSLPQPALAEFGGTISFAAAANGTPPLVYQWRFHGTNLPGATNATLTLYYVSGEDAGAYEVDAINPDTGHFIRADVQLTVGSAPPAPPILTAQPRSQKVLAGQEGQFRVKAIGAEPFGYQWLKDGLPIPGATNAVYSRPNVTDADDGAYGVIISNPFGSVPSDFVTLTVLRPAAVDPNFWPPSYADPLAFVLSAAIVSLPDGGIFLGFTSRRDWIRTGRLDWLYEHGSLRRQLLPSIQGDGGRANAVTSLAAQSDGGMLVAGEAVFDGFNFALWRLRSYDSLDSAFNWNLLGGANGGIVRCLSVQVDGKVLVGGYFNQLGWDLPCTNLARLFPDGRLDTDFHPRVTGAVTCLVPLPDGRILAGGSFASRDGVERSGVVRLHADGAVDTTFVASVGGGVNCLAVQPDDKILVGGSFTNLNGHPCVGLGRLNPDGGFDALFTPTIVGRFGEVPHVKTLGLQSDGGILVGGSFVSVGGQPRANLARLHPDGHLDDLFNVWADAEVMSLAVQPSGKVVASGPFTSMSGVTRGHINRINNTESATQRLAYDGSTIRWQRGGTGPEVWATQFEFSTNNGWDWFELGRGTRVPGGWELPGVSLPDRARLRARGLVSGGGIASSWVETTIETTRPAPPEILAGSLLPSTTPSAGFAFKLTGNPGQVVVVEGSTDLLHWAPIFTTILGSDVQRFSDSIPAVSEARFYRLKYLLP